MKMKKGKKEILTETGTGQEKMHESGGILGRLVALTTSTRDLPDAKVLAKRALRGLAFAIVSFFLSKTSLTFDTYPLGIALISTSESGIVYLLLGAILSAFTVTAGENGILFSPYIYAAAYLMIPLVRMTTRCFIDVPEGFSPRLLFSSRDKKTRNSALGTLWRSRFGENIYLRMATACVASFLVSIYAMSNDGYRFYDLFSAMFAMIAAPAFTFLFSGIYSERKTRIEKVIYYAACLGLLFSFTFSLRTAEIFGINGAVFVAFVASLLASRHIGVLGGSITGITAGLAVSTVYAPSFILAAIASGVLWSGSGFAAVCTSCTVALLWGAYIKGFTALGFLVPGLLSAAVFALAADSVMLLPKGGVLTKKTDTSYAKYDAEEEVLESAEPVKNRIMRLSETFSELSSTLYSLSDRLRTPGESEIRSICETSCKRYCDGCVRSDECRFGNYRSYSELVGKMSEVLLHDGRIGNGKVPEYLSERCFNFELIREEANTEFAEMIKSCLENEKTELFALDYDAVSHILAEAVDAEKKERIFDTELCQHIEKTVNRPDIGVREITVNGVRKKQILVGNLGRKAEEMGVNELREKFESACGFPLTEPVFELHGSKVSMKCESARRYKAEGAVAMISAEGEVCGDSVQVFETDDDKFYSLISDGMGSGSDAALTSEICCEFLKKMLEGRNRKETSLKMLNTLLRAKGRECSATVDLMEIDLIGGQASFVKSGAAPSFVRRGDKLYKLRSNTVPIGILRAVEAEQLRFDLEAGDVIIMLSDGVSQSPEECVWLMDILGSFEADTDLKSLADSIAERALSEGSNDDLSVAVVRVGSKNSSKKL